MASVELNFSNNVMNTKQIEGLLRLFEGSGDVLFNFWKDNCVNTSALSTADIEDLRRNFPKKNYLREVIMKLAGSMPPPKISAAAPRVQVKPAAKPVAKDGPPAPKEEGPQPDQALQQHLDDLCNRTNWEGNKDFMSALPWWRCFVLVAGDLFVKLPTDDPEDQSGLKTLKVQCYPERMPAQRTYIKMSPSVRKLVDGYRFMYYLGTGVFTEGGDMSQLVTEIITREGWDTYPAVAVAEKDTVSSLLVKGERALSERKALNQDAYEEAQRQAIATGATAPVAPQPDADLGGMLPVAHMAWEEREEGARGIPLAEILLDKVLHLYSAEMDRRMGNKMGSVPMYVGVNVSGAIPPVAAGTFFLVKTVTPSAPADVKPLISNFNDESLQRETVDAKRELYHAAFLPFEAEPAQAIGDKSGKALQMLSKDQVKYREMFQSAETRFLKDLFSKAVTLEGRPTKPEEVGVNYDDLMAPSSSEKLAEASFYEDAGYHRKALETMGNDEEDIADMLDERDADRAEAMLSFKPDQQVDENGNQIPPIPAMKGLAPIAAPPKGSGQ